jgi:chemotaxis protein methyltransferase CheR
MITPFETKVIPVDEKKSLEYIGEWLSARTGLSFPPSKQHSLYHRLQRVCLRLDLQNLNEMAHMLMAQQLPSLPVELVKALSTNHTFFFREEETLNFFSNHIVPDLPNDEPWRIWSAATASGDEAYTIAILLAEHLGLFQLQEKVAILGTDISEHMINVAERGIYPETNIDHVPAELRKRYFKPTGHKRWEIHPMISQVCTFRRLNLKKKPFPFRQPFHVIFCRNVFYYFGRDHQQELAERLFDITIPGGWLITSVTESLHELHLPWKKICSGIWHKEPRKEDMSNEAE